MSQVAEALEMCDSILELVLDLPEKAEEFADSIQTKAIDIKEFIEKNNKVTSGQFSALENMKRGAEKWRR